MQLPSIGDVQGQAQAGQNLAQQIETATGPGGDPGALLSEGIAIAGTAIGGSTGMAISSAAGILAGAAMAGPVGAAIALVGTVTEFLSSVNGIDSAEALGASKATATIASRIRGYGTPIGAGPNFGAPGGWSAADWSAFARPPKGTSNPLKLLTMMKMAFRFYTSTPEGRPFSNGSFQDENSAVAFARKQKPLCTPIWFYWYSPGLIVDCDKDLNFGSKGAGASVGELHSRWVQGTTAVGRLTQSQIVSNAIKNLPDQMYWASDLYGTTLPSGFSGYVTEYYNVDLINAMATVLNMVSRGASLQAIISELLIQSYILSVQGGVNPTGGKISNTTENQYGFHQLVDDYLRMAQTAGVAAPPPDLTFGQKFGGVLGGAAGVTIGSLLLYSLVTKTSPVTVAQGAVTRLRRL